MTEDDYIARFKRLEDYLNGKTAPHHGSEMRAKISAAEVMCLRRAFENGYVSMKPRTLHQEFERRKAE